MDNIKSSPLKTVSRQLVAICSFLAVLLLTACQNAPTETASPSSKKIQGITLATWSAVGYNAFSTGRQIEQIAAIGANNLAVLITGYQSQISASEIRIDAQKTPGQESIENCVTMARRQGLEITLKPHINVDDGSWSGNIAPSDPAAWFAAYQQFILPLAATAEANGLSQFIIGTELAGTLTHEEFWLETIEKVRNVYSGEVIYAASWDEASRVPFWDLLDYIGVNFYFPVADRHDPSRLEILKGWQPWLGHLERLHKKYNRNIILTEIGYRSIDGAGMQPHDFQQFSRTDADEQADLYWAAFEATSDVNWIDGMYWWNWLADGQGGIGNPDYTPSAKPAEREIMSAWRSAASN